VATVTSLRAAGGDRVTVLLDGEPALVLSAVAALQLGLSRGRAVDADAWRHATEVAEAEAAEAAAARLLAARSRTRQDLRRRLAARFPAAAVEQAIDHLQSTGAISDEAFANHWLDAHADTLGTRALVAGLLREGVPAALAKRLVAERAPADEAETATGLARSVAARYRSLPPDVAARRLWDFLARRGFGVDAARRAVRAALQVDLEEDA
jgi:SOS response regulatory protein OraA/RecX